MPIPAASVHDGSFLLAVAKQLFELLFIKSRNAQFKRLNTVATRFFTYHKIVSVFGNRFHNLAPQRLNPSSSFFSSHRRKISRQDEHHTSQSSPWSRGACARRVYWLHP